MQSFRAIRFFDSGAQVSSGVPVIQQVRARMPAEWRAALLARDGAVITSVLAQIQQLLASASHLVFSVGGNDAIRYRHIRSSPASVSSVVLREIVSPVEPAETGGAEIAELLQKNSVQPRFFTREDGSFSVRGHCRAEVTGRLLFVSAGQGLSGGGIYAEFFQADPDRRQ
jgi:hypothetical protein